MASSQILQLRDDLRLTTEVEIGIDPVLCRCEPQLLQPGDLGLSEGLVHEICESGPPPQRKRLP